MEMLLLIACMLVLAAAKPPNQRPKKARRTATTTITIKPRRTKSAPALDVDDGLYQAAEAYAELALAYQHRARTESDPVKRAKLKCKAADAYRKADCIAAKAND